MQSRVIAPAVVVPGSINVFLDFFGGFDVHRMNPAQIPVKDNAAGHFVTVDVIVPFGGQVSVREVIYHPAADFSPIALVYLCNHQEVGDIHLLYENFRFVQQLLYKSQAFGIDGVRFFQVDAARHPADSVIGMRIFPSENGVDFHHVTLPFKRFKVMGDCDEVLLGRKPVSRMPPVTVGENTQLPAFDKRSYAGLNVPEISRRTVRPV